MAKCRQCSTGFEITAEDRQFYSNVGALEPTLCPLCRMQKRTIFRNERCLYQRKCNLTGKSIITVYHPDAPFPVYDSEVWHSDKWDPLSYGMDFDFSRPFFEQFKRLYDCVPRANLFNQASENSEYSHYAYRNKNGYLLFGSHYNEDSLYGDYIWKCVSSMDCTIVTQSELVYEGYYCDRCYRCLFAEYCFDCSDCSFCYDLVGCRHCLFSSNLRNKEYYILNQPYPKEEYEKKLQELRLNSYSTLQELIKRYQEVKLKAIHRALFQVASENCFGHNIQNSKNVYIGFNTQEAEDCRYCLGGPATHLKDSMDVSFIGYDLSELLYQCINNSGNHTAFCCVSCWHSADLYYCELCLDSQNLFGCVGLKNKKYCILNKQYSKEEYEALKAKIIEHMKKTGEWSEFFPMSVSPFAYNETVAQRYIPLTKEEALKKGLWWRDPDPKDYKPQSFSVPDSIKEADDSLCDQVLACMDCGKNYKIVPLELKLYRQMNLAIPRRCPDCRHQLRFKPHSSLRLYERKCDNCKKAIASAYATERPETVYCEPCYLKEVY